MERSEERDAETALLRERLSPPDLIKARSFTITFPLAVRSDRRGSAQRYCGQIS